MISITDSINILSMYFLENNTLKFTDLHKLIPEQFTTDKEKDAILASLIAALSFSDFSNLVQSVYVIPSDLNTLHFILKKPLSLEKQTVQISGNTASHMSAIINNFINDNNSYVNPLNITETDIQHLINIIQFLSENESETTDKKSK